MSSRCLITVLLGFALLSIPASAGNIDFDDDTNAKMALIKARKRHREAMRTEQTASQESGEENEESDEASGHRSKTSEPEASCGSVSIGNTVSQRGRQAPREITVIVTGDVINANNKCK